VFSGIACSHKGFVCSLYDVVEESSEKTATRRASDEDDMLSRKEAKAARGYPFANRE